jgi:hypothetical protein
MRDLEFWTESSSVGWGLGRAVQSVPGVGVVRNRGLVGKPVSSTGRGPGVVEVTN